MKKPLTLISVLSAWLVASALAQEKQNAAPARAATNAPNAGTVAVASADKLADGAMVSCGIYRSIRSRVLGEARTVLIRVPDDYATGQKRYPVLYKLDGDKSVFLQTVGAVEYLADWKQGPDYIVVGMEITDRRRDMVPELGADAFLRFFAEELVPFVDANYRTSESRVLCGQSASSVFALYACLRVPELFDGYVLSSFGLSEESRRGFETELGRRSRTARSPHWVYVGNNRVDIYDHDGSRARNGLAFLDSLKKAERPAMNLECRVFEEEGHVPFPTIYYALRWMAAAKAQPTNNYLGQATPGKVPEVFARGLVSTDHLEHSAPAFSPDGNEVFWSLWRRPEKGEPQVILTMRREGGAWSAPAVAPFSGKFLDGGPVFSADGRRLYLYSTRPTPAGGTSDDIWLVEKQDKGWSEPRCLGFVARFPELTAVYQPSIARNGTLYFISRPKITPLDHTLEGPPNPFLIYRAALINGEYSKPERLPRNINGPDAFINWTPFIAPDESYLLFSSGRRDGHGGGDLYLARRASDGTWSQPEILPDSINTPEQERFPWVSPDGQYLFFTRSTREHYHDVFWVSAVAIPALRGVTNSQPESSK